MMSDYFLALLLSVIQGLTEFLPVSSSAHLLLPSLLFGAKDFGLIFDIAVHAGTLLAVIFYFREDLLKIISAWLPWNSTRNSEDFNLGLNLIIASLPIVFVGLFFSDLTDSRVHDISSIAWSNLIFGLILFIAFKASKQTDSLLSLTIGSALSLIHI